MAWWWAELWPAHQQCGLVGTVGPKVNLGAWPAQKPWDAHHTDRTQMPESHIFWGPVRSLLRELERSCHGKAYSHALDSSFLPPLAPIFCLPVFSSIRIFCRTF